MKPSDKNNLRLITFPKEQDFPVVRLVEDIELVLEKHKSILADVCLTSRPLSKGHVETMLSIDIDVGGIV
jgi:hypothetical protein